MRIGLIVDTHMPIVEEKVPLDDVTQAFRGGDLILQAGDVYDTVVLKICQFVC